MPRLRTTPARRLPAIAGSLAIGIGACAIAQGEPANELRPVDRRFTFLEETLHGAPPGHFEIEQWVTWKTHTHNDHGFDRLDVKHEVEYGISDTVHFALDLAEWHWTDSASERVTKYDATAAELKLRLLDPRKDAVGLGFKTEVGLGPHGFEWENVLIVDKIIERWDLAYNLKVEAEWEGEKTFDVEEHNGEIVQSAGVSYEMSPTLFLGTELVYEIPLPDWDSGERTNLFLGPNMACRGRNWAFTTTPLVLVTGGDDEPAFQLRLIFEVDF